MKEQVIGSTLPVLEVSLDPGESVVAEVGEWQVSTPVQAGMLRRPGTHAGGR